MHLCMLKSLRCLVAALNITIYIYITKYITKELTIMQGSKLDSNDNSLDLKAA